MRVEPKRTPSHRPHAGPRPRLAGWSGLATAMLLIAPIVAWQLGSEPSHALTTLMRSAPPLRAFNLTRHTLGVDLDLTTRPASRLEPILDESTYAELMGKPRDPAPNVVLIILESVPARALHCYGHRRDDVSPNLDQLAEDGVLLEHAISSASFSAYGVVSTITSLYLLRGESYDFFKDTSFPFLGLPRALRLAGYETAIFSSGNETFDNICAFYPRKDFDTYFSRDGFRVPGSDSLQDSMRMDDRYAVTRFESWIDSRTDARPFYSQFYLQATHFNYEVPEPWSSHYRPALPLYSSGSAVTRIPDEALPVLKNQYDNAMRYADHWVGRIRAAMQRNGQLDNAIIVVVGDHGEGFMEHGLARHGTSVWEEMIHVPLIVYVGDRLRESINRPLPSRVAGTVSNLDIVPTIAAAIGIVPHPTWQGVDVLDDAYTGDDRPVFSMIQLWSQWQEVAYCNKWKYVYDLNNIKESLYDLNIDPGETTNVLRERPELSAAMNQLLGTWHTLQLDYYDPAHRPFTHTLGPIELNPGLINQLHDLTTPDADLAEGLTRQVESRSSDLP